MPSFDSLDAALKQPTAVEELTITFPRELARVVVPPGIAEMANLRALTINSHEARALEGGEFIPRLPSLKSLNLSLGFGEEGELLEFPPWIYDMSTLQSLSVGGRFGRVLDRLGDLVLLERLYFTGSPRGGASFRDRSQRGFAVLPESIGSLGRLSRLSLMDCDLMDLPATLGRLSRLESLSLFDTRLMALPESLGGLRSLKELAAIQNQELRSVPEVIGELPHLTTVDLSSNDRLESVPASLLRVKTLKIERWKRPAKSGARKSRPFDPMAALLRAAKKKERPAFVPTLGKHSEGRSHLGGIPWLARGEAWPECAICGRRMPLWIQLFAGDAPEEMRASFDGGALQWFRCMGGPTFDRLRQVRREQPKLLAPEYVTRLDALTAGASEGDAGFLARAPCMFLAADVAGSSFQLARIVDAEGPGRVIAEQEAAPDTFGPLQIAGWERIIDRPQVGQLGVADWWKIVELLDNEQREIVTRWNSHREKLGGWPTWLQDRDVRKCPRCRSGLRQLVFQVDQDDFGSVPSGYSGKVFLLQCPKHPRSLAGIAQFS